MCLLLREESLDGKLRIAEEDIVCYKVISCTDGIYLTPFMGYDVKIGNTYDSKLVRERLTKSGILPYNKIHWKYSVNIGIHSVKTLGEAYKLARAITHPPERNILNYVAQCVIPKGSKYYAGTFVYTNYYESYVSDTIRYETLMDPELYESWATRLQRQWDETEA